MKNIILLAAAAALLVFMLPEPSQLKAPAKVNLLTNSDTAYTQFCRTGLNKAITDFNLTKDTILFTISSLCLVYDVNVKIDTVLHSFISDLVVRLTKDGNTVLLVNQRGAGGSNFINTRLNDSAVFPISSGNPPFNGEFRPETPLSVFNNNTANGNWILSIRDTASADTGVLKSWCISIKYECFGAISTTDPVIPQSYSLGQNYPNPFNPATSIRFGIPNDSRNEYTKIVIYDALGRETEVILNQKLTAGNYEINWNASAYPSGVYYYKIISGGFSDVRKMVLVK